MPAATDLKWYLSENDPEDDTSSAGGAIRDAAHASGGRIPLLANLTVDDELEAVSDGADVRTVDFYGRHSTTLEYVTEQETLNGVTPTPATTITFDSFLRAVLSAKDAARTVTIRRNTAGGDLATLGPNIVECAALFRKAASEAGAVSRYSYVYAKNEHATESFENGKVQLSDDPAGGADLFIAVRSTIGNMSAETNRKTSPTGFAAFVDDSVLQNIPNSGVLVAGAAICVAVRQDLSASQAAQRSTYQIEFQGTSAAGA